MNADQKEIKVFLKNTRVDVTQIAELSEGWFSRFQIRFYPCKSVAQFASAALLEKYLDLSDPRLSAANSCGSKSLPQFF